MLRRNSGEVIETFDVRVTTRNRLTLTKAFVDRMGIEPGDDFIFQIDDDGTVRFSIGKRRENR